jgi:hypothetical protein
MISYGYALSVTADYMGYDSVSGHYMYDVNIHDLAISPTNPVSAYDLDISYSANTFAMIRFSGALGEPSPYDLSATGSVDGTYSFGLLNLTPGLIDFKEQTYYGAWPGDETTLYNHQSQPSYYAGGVLTLARLFFVTDPTVTNPGLTFVNWYSGSGLPPNNNEIKLFDNTVLYDGSAPVPEPASLLLLASGLAAVAVRRRIARS